MSKPKPPSAPELQGRILNAPETAEAHQLTVKVAPGTDLQTSRKSTVRLSQLLKRIRTKRKEGGKRNDRAA